MVWLVKVLAAAALAALAMFAVAYLSANTKAANTPPANTDAKCDSGNGSGFCGFATGGPCKSDADCVRDGCSGQVCRSVSESPVITTCEWRECYDADKYHVTCKCVDGKCTWAKCVDGKCTRAPRR